MRFGINQTDMEQRIDFDRLRRERLARAQKVLIESDVDALLKALWARLGEMALRVKNIQQFM